MVAAKPRTKLYCNTLAIEKGFDPVGHAEAFEDLVVFEVPLPWKSNLYDKAGTLPQEVLDLFDLWLKRYQAGEGYPHRALFIAPDAAYSHDGYRRVMFYTRREGMIAQYDKVEYLVPEEQTGTLIWSLYEARENLAQFEPYRHPTHDATRDLLVCTHGSVDVACAKFGYPLYNTLRKHHANERLRVWRVSHFGGHIFAPTMIDMPTGHYWAYIENPQAAQIVQKQGGVRRLYGHYRGWAAFENGFLQAAERELWMQYGWAWFSYHKSGRILSQDTKAGEPSWAEVEIECAAPDSSERAVYRARVDIHRHISTPHSSDSDAGYSYPQYVVTDIRRM